MRKRLVFGFAALIVASGCATGQKGSMTPMAQSNSWEYPMVEFTDKAPPKVGDFTGSASERTPAQSSHTKWVEDSKSISISPNGGSTSITLSPRQVLHYYENYTYSCEKPGWGTTTCTDWVCSGGEGKSELWNDYYSAPRDQKVSALNKALLGIGQSSARSLHESGLFQKKARSWQEFRDRMNTALRRGVITNQQYNEVFGTYGEQNRRNLGYAGENCRSQYYSCEVYALFPATCEGTRPAERVINVFNKTIQINVDRPQLQSFENESLTISSGPDFESITVYRADKTDYRVTKQPAGDGAIINLEGVGRYQINLPSQALQEVRFNDSRGNNMNAVITVDPRYIGQGDDKLIVKLEVSHCLPGGFWSVGDCKGNDEKSKVRLAPIFQTVTQAKSSFALPAIPAGHKVWVAYSLQRENSRWYNNSPVAKDEIKLKELKK